ncbi:MAG: hypothetical protein ACRCSG_03640 [Cellulosilyticaceae bacterium]
MKKIKNYIAIALVAAISSSSVYAYSSNYLTQAEYKKELEGNLYEDRGIVIKNEPMLGYLEYRNGRGDIVTASYYAAEMKVEKAPYYEEDDTIGYIDEMFPSIGFDVRDTTIGQVRPGDNIYVRMDEEGYVTYMSVYNEYAVRYGKVHTSSLGADGIITIVLEETNGKMHTYKVSQNIPISKGSGAYSIGRLKEGEWIRVLVSQKILGYGMIEEQIKEIKVDPDTRVISDVYRGEVIDANPYQQTVTLKNSQTLNKSGWSMYETMRRISTNPKILSAYFLGNPVSFDYISKTLKNSGYHAYVAVEKYMGKEQAIKINFQRDQQRTLPISRVTYASPGVMQLMSGERIMLSEDTILVRDNRLVGTAGVNAGDTIQAVVTGENKLAYGRILENIGLGGLQVFRGRIKSISDYEQFEVETFSMLENNEWYFNPSPRTFSIGVDTKLYTSGGLETGGIKNFLDHGEFSVTSDVFTIVADGDRAVMISAMPYTKEAVRGEVYDLDGSIQLKDIYTYDRKKDQWKTAVAKNTTVTLNEIPNGIMIKNGKLITTKQLEKGDKLTIMLEEPLDTTLEGNSDGQSTNGLRLKVDGYIVLVE